MISFFPTFLSIKIIHTPSKHNRPPICIYCSQNKKVENNFQVLSTYGKIQTLRNI
ncbi:hypothetical protein HanIR_Chr07g0321381 [Helianthus annuus]|nr:hypothetical protein HanIR_Chr07g0321381 [Helianthus annuus]